MAQLDELPVLTNVDDNAILLVEQDGIAYQAKKSDVLAIEKITRSSADDNLQAQTNDLAAKINTQATDTNIGITRYSTQAETNAGLIDIAAVTPLKLLTWWASVKATAQTIGATWTFTLSPIFSALGAGQVVKTDGSKKLVSEAVKTAHNKDFGVLANTVTEGNDTRVPTQDENDALIGTNGTPSSLNKYVTDSDTRLVLPPTLSDDMGLGGDSPSHTVGTTQNAVRGAIEQAISFLPPGTQQFDGDDDPNITPPAGALNGAYYAWHPADEEDITVKKFDGTAWQTQYIIRQNNGSGTITGTSIGATVYKSALQTIANNLNTVISFDQDDVGNTPNMHDDITNNSRLVATNDGIYIPTAQIALNAYAGGVIDITIVKNGATVIGRMEDVFVSGTKYISIIGAPLTTSGDYVELFIKQVSGAPVDLIQGLSGTWFSFQRQTAKGETGPVGPSGIINSLGSIAYVSNNGSNVTGVLGRIDKPFLTHDAASAVTPIGGGVHAILGTYGSWTTKKDGVTYTADKGSVFNFAVPVDIANALYPVKIYLKGTTINYSGASAFVSASGGAFFNELHLGDVLTSQVTDIKSLNIVIASGATWDIQGNNVQGNLSCLMDGDMAFKSNIKFSKLEGVAGNTYSSLLSGAIIDINTIKTKPFTITNCIGYVRHLATPTANPNIIASHVDLEIGVDTGDTGESIFSVAPTINMTQMVSGAYLKVRNSSGAISYITPQDCGASICSITIDVQGNSVLDVQNTNNDNLLVNYTGNIQGSNGAVNYPYIAKARGTNTRLVIGANIYMGDDTGTFLDCTQGEITINGTIKALTSTASNTRGVLILSGGTVIFNADVDFWTKSNPITLNSGKLIINSKIRSLGAMIGGQDTIIKKNGGTLITTSKGALIGLGSGLLYSISSTLAATAKIQGFTVINLPVNNITNSLAFGLPLQDAAAE